MALASEVPLVVVSRQVPVLVEPLEVLEVQALEVQVAGAGSQGQSDSRSSNALE